MRKHFVTFFSPGTFFSETSAQDIDNWDVKEALRRAKKVTERYNARPYAFQFTTRSRGESDLDSKVSDTSGMYYITGHLETIDDVARRADPGEKILLSNMKCNQIARVVIGSSPWKFCQPFNKGDFLLVDGRWQS